ncbi:MAG: hypothetical protein HYS38_02175 [Acidobacteria bacterium]|nr:hypothetical protein [Acidobacteriota bacterium]
MRNSAREAVGNALAFMSDSGFVHDLDSITLIEIHDVRRVGEEARYESE